MKYFKLPDLGEGLTEAEIVQWHVKAGESVSVDQQLLSVETAKAIVEVPSPQTGIIAACFGEEGDVVHIGEPLVEFEGQHEDSGTVVGDLSQQGQAPKEDIFIVGSVSRGRENKIKATPSVRAMAKRLGVDIQQVQGTGADGKITSDDVESAAHLDQVKGTAENLRGVRKTMAKTMSRSHSEVVPVTIYDDADIHLWDEQQDVTMRLVRAISIACEAEPALNVWFDGENLSRRLLKQVDIAIAVDTDSGLFVPILRDISHRSMIDLRKGLDQLRADVKGRTIPASEMQGATITLSNFGTMAGRYASPIVVPPTVAIVGAGVIRDQVVAYNKEAAIHPLLPISITFDHRAVTGGEAARFLIALIQDLQK